MQQRLRQLPRRALALLVVLQFVLVCGLFLFNFRSAAAKPAAELSLAGFSCADGQITVTDGAQGGVLFIPAQAASGDSVELRGEAISLPRGSYTLHIRYNASGSAYSALSLSGAEETAHADLLVPRHEAELSFLLPQDTSGLQMVLQCAAGSEVELLSVTARPTADLANRGVLVLALVFLLSDLAVWLLRTKTKEQIGVFCAVTAIGLFASMPFLTEYVTSGLDLRFHMTRIEGIAQGLLSGQFPVRMQDIWYGGAGYPVSVMYGDLFLYFPALLRILGASIPVAFNVFRIALTLLCVGCSYHAFFRIFRHRAVALLGAGVYTLCPYRLTDIFNRAAIGEATAISLFPLVLLGVYLIYFEEHSRGWLWLSLGMTGILFSHLLSCELAAGFLLLWMLVFLRRTFRPAILLQLFKAAGASVGLSLWFLLPFLDYSRLPMDVFARPAFSLQDSRVFLPQLFGLFSNVTGSDKGFSDGFVNELNYSVGLTMLLGVFALLYGLYFYWGSEANEDERRILRLGKGSLVIVALLTAAVLGLLPLDFLQQLSPLLAKAISSLQLLTRLLVPLSMALALCTCCGLWLLARKKAAGRQILVAGICLCAVIASSYYTDEALGRVFAPLDVYGPGQLGIYTNHMDEYLLTAANPDTFTTISSYTQDTGVQVLEEQRQSLSVTVRCANEGGAPGRVITPLLYYPYYRAVDDLTGEELPLGMGPDGYIQVEIVPGYNGQFTVFYREPAFWRAAELVSLVSAAGFAWVWKRGVRLPLRAR